MSTASTPSRKRATTQTCQFPSGQVPYDPDRLTKQAVRDGKLLRPKRPSSGNAVPKFKQIFDQYGASLCVCVLPNVITAPFYNFESSYHIYFQYKVHKLKQQQKNAHLLSANDLRTITCYAYYHLPLHYDQLTKMDKFIKKNNKERQFFAEPFPKPDSRTEKKRGDLQQMYNYEERLFTKPSLTSGKSFSFGARKSMTNRHLEQYADYLHRIFASPVLLLHDEFYQILEINDPEIINLLKTLALKKIESMRSESVKYSGNRCIRDPTKLQKKREIIFHTLWVVKRPLNNKTASFVGCDHWALKFEGNKHLMTVGWFAYNEQHGIILIKIVPNTPLNRRLFWFYWPRDSIPADKLEARHFNERWTPLEKIYLHQMSCELVGILIEEWLKYDNHAVYDLTHNNCQHFCRDMAAPLDISVAKRLSASFDVRFAKSLVPAGILAEGIDAEAKCNNAWAKLYPLCEQYKRNRQRRQQQEEKEDETAAYMNNLQFVAQQLGIQLSAATTMTDLDLDELSDHQDIEEEDADEEEAKQSQIGSDEQDSLTIYTRIINNVRDDPGMMIYDEDSEEEQEQAALVVNNNQMEKPNENENDNKAGLDKSIDSAQSKESDK